MLCVADGAGDEPTSLQASRLAAQLAEDGFRKLPKAPSHELLQTLQRLVEGLTRDYFEITGADPGHNNYNTTLAIALLIDDWIALASVGDAFAAVASGGEVDLVLCADRPAGISSSATYMIADWADHTRYLTIWDPNARCVMLSTDGLEKFIVYRPVVSVDGAKLQVPFGVNEYLERVIMQFASGDAELAREAIARPEVRSFKNDDVAVAVGYR